VHAAAGALLKPIFQELPHFTLGLAAEIFTACCMSPFKQQ